MQANTSDPTAAGDNGWLSDAWDFVDGALGRANDIYDTYRKWEVRSDEAAWYDVRSGLWGNPSDPLAGLPPSRRAGDASGSQTGGRWPARQGTMQAGFGGLSPTVLAVLGVGALLLVSR